MKNFRILFMLAATVLFFVACEKTEPIIFDGGQTLAFFNKDASKLAVSIGATGTDTIKVGVTTLSDKPRTVKVLIVDSLTTADPANYTIENLEVTIPAGKYFGNLIINGTDNSVTIQPELIGLKLVSITGTGILSKENHTVSVFQVCDVPDTFLVGQYKIEDVLATTGPGNGTSNFETSVVDISVGEVPTDRVFDVTVFPGFGVPTRTVTISLICNNFVLQPVNTLLACDGVTDLIYTAATDAGAPNATYDLQNIQNEYIITYSEDTDGSCGGPFVSSFKLTKI